MPRRNELAAQRRADWVAEHGPCKSCGSTEDLEVDHIDWTTKEIEISKVWHRRQEVRDAELAKCQVLCDPCHNAKSAQEARERAIRVTHCKSGHPVSRLADGSPRCYPCENERRREAHAERGVTKRTYGPAGRTHCYKGHEKAISPKGRLWCPECGRQAQQRFKESHGSGE